MNERLDHARQLGRRIDAGWQRADVEAQLARLQVRQARARRRWVAVPVIGAAVAVAVFAVFAVVGPGGRGASPPGPVVATATATAEQPAPSAERAPVVVTRAAVPEGPALASGVLSLGDGSIVTPLDQASRLLARQVSETDVVVALSGGGARFDVPARAARRFRAELDGLALETRGGAFRVAIARHQIEVVAERGEVSARWGRERRVVAAGETRAFPAAGLERERDERAHDDVARADRDAPIAASEPQASWRDDAGRGDYAAAWVAFERAAAPIESMADLLLAGDVARLSGHAAAAVAQLSRAVALHPADPRAPLAAFTLGRVHLEELGAPRHAALAFARARELAPGGPLAEDALAREVEAWSRAGETETARARAQDYVRRYPQGHRAHAVRRFGGLEGP